MESKRPAAGTYPLHLRYRWQPDGFCGKKDHEPAFRSAGLGLGYHLYITHHHSMAIGCITGKHSLRPISVLY